jgi:hypothetical protein
MADFIGWLGQSGVVQGVVIGATLAFLTAIGVMNIVAKTITTTTDGWSSIRACGQPDNGILVRAACAKALPIVNVFEEAAYWTTGADDSGRTLTGMHDYVMHFPPGQLPPNNAFWSLTLTDVAGYMMNNAPDRHSVGDSSQLVQNPDGSVDVFLQHEAPQGYEENWLPTPRGSFRLMLRAYLPGAAILTGTYRVPKVSKAL